MASIGISRALGLASVAGLLMARSGAAMITIDTVPVENPGNVADSTGYGAVNYNYGIGKYEVTSSQYASFLNAVAGVDTFGLFNASMSGTTKGSGILRSGTGVPANPFTYAVAAGNGNRPVNFLTFWSMVRFVNWLENGQPTGAQDASTTEDGSYTLTPGGISGNTITRNANARWVLPTEDEWYKAAYYHPSAGNYYLYPTSSNTLPGHNVSDPLPGNNANYNFGGNPVAIDSIYFMNNVGAFQNSASSYGTFDQAGNVWEMQETITNGVDRVLRGGSWAGSSPDLASSFRNFFDPTDTRQSVGFRIALVPEPASVGILGIGVMGMLVRRKR